MTRALTVSAKWLEMAAIKLEIDAEASLATWIVLGQAHRYCDNLGRAAMFRRAIQITSIAQRRDFLRDNGIKV